MEEERKTTKKRLNLTVTMPLPSPLPFPTTYTMFAVRRRLDYSRRLRRFAEVWVGGACHIATAIRAIAIACRLTSPVLFLLPLLKTTATTQHRAIYPFFCGTGCEGARPYWLSAPPTAITFSCRAANNFCSAAIHCHRFALLGKKKNAAWSRTPASLLSGELPDLDVGRQAKAGGGAWGRAGAWASKL